MERLASMENPEWNSGDAALAQLKEIIEDCKQKGLIQNGDTDAIAMTVWGMVHGLVSLRVCKRFEKLVEANEVVDTMHRSLDWLIQSISLHKTEKN
jgi:hypothetical protein